MTAPLDDPIDPQRSQYRGEQVVSQGFLRDRPPFGQQRNSALPGRLWQPGSALACLGVIHLAALSRRSFHKQLPQPRRRTRRYARRFRGRAGSGGDLQPSRIESPR